MITALLILIICSNLLLGFFLGKWYQSEKNLILLHKFSSDYDELLQSYIDMVHRLAHGEFGHTPQDIEAVCIQLEKIERRQAS